MAVALESQTILDAARDLVPAVRARGDEIAAARRLPADLVAMLRHAGVFRMPMPRAWGGPEMTPRAQTEVVEHLSAADPSVGWCVMIGSDSGFYGAFLDDAVARGLYPDLDAITAGLLQPGGQAHRVGGGYRVSGRWGFGSGCTHADVLVGGCLVFENGAPRMTERGLPEWRVMMAPAREWQVLDTWHTTGLAGSGSNDYTAQDLFVPAERTFSLFEKPAREWQVLDTWHTTGLAGSGSNDYTAQDLFVPAERTFSLFEKPARTEPLYAFNGMFFANMHGVPLGLARRAIDCVRELAEQKTIVPDMVRMRDVPRVRAALARAEMQLGAARAYTYDTLDRVWERLSAGDGLGRDERVALALSRIHCFRTARGITQDMADTAGTAAIYATSPLDRLLRDAITICQHVVAQDRMLELVGGLVVGDESRLPFV
jgi:alkylation response protein AidB-like acyl-CoA dehydrogenase